MSLIGPHGTALRLRAPRPIRSRLRSRSMASSNGTSIGRWRTRSALRAKRGSRASSGRPATSQNLTNWLSLPTATIRSHRRQRTPDRARCSDARFPRAPARTPGRQVVHVHVGEHCDHHVVQRDVDVLPGPGPLAVRHGREDRNAEYIPVIRSLTATPAFCGPPPGRSSRSPVIYMKPPLPWMMKS